MKSNNVYLILTGIIVFLALAAAMIQPITTAAGNLSYSDSSGTVARGGIFNLFNPTGVVLIIVVVGIFYAVYKMAMHKNS